MPELTREQIGSYNRDGFIAPINIYSPEEAAALRQELEDLEALHPEAVTGRNRNNVHYVTTLFDKIAHNPNIRSEERRVGKECRSRWSPYH